MVRLIDGWIDKTDKCMDGQMKNGWIEEQIDGYMLRQIGGWIDKQMDKWLDKQMD